MGSPEDLTEVRDSIQQEITALHVRNKIAQLYRHIVQVDAFIQGKVNTGSFDEIPLSIKQDANRGWTLIKQVIQGFESDQELMGFINWYEAISE